MALGALKAIPTIEDDPCGWHMQDYLDAIRSHYRAGWNDAIEGRASIQSNIHYTYGYDDATEYQYSFRQ